MGRLALVGSTRLNLVSRTNRDVQLFIQIPIEIPKKNTDTAVRILEPTLIGGRYVLTRGVQRFHGQLSGLRVYRQRRPHERPACEQDCKISRYHRRPQRAHRRILPLTLSCVPQSRLLKSRMRSSNSEKAAAPASLSSSELVAVQIGRAHV